MRKLGLGVVGLLALALVAASLAANGHANFHAVCPGAEADSARCHADVLADERGNPQATTSPTGYGPTQFRTAYGLTSASSAQTIGIVDAFDDPTVASDLSFYSSTYGIPCNSCLTVVKQAGKVRFDAGWALEISLDVQIAHAVCPTCHILLVEAKSNSFSNLLAAEDYAVAHANVVSNSWGAGEFSGESSYDSHFDHPGTPITFSSGDNGYGVEYPAASRFVTAVGGTTLSLNADGTRASETAWSGAGSGCSAFETKPSWQADGGCARRTVADVSADANPSTGASVYDSSGYSGQKGWFQVGGTSLAAPLVASVYALAGNASSTVYGSYPYANASGLFDVASGSNGSCAGSYLCTAGTGFDGPTGLGSPIGTSGF